jgi:HK97 family phage prohead protease
MDKNTCDFTGWATRYDVRCADGRTIKPNAFIDNDGSSVPLVWNHGHDDARNVLGHALLFNKPTGVYCEGFCNDTPEGRRAKEMIKHHDVTALSIYANNLKQTPTGGNEKDVTHGMIRELSLVLAGANPGAYIDSVLCHSEDGSVRASETEAFIYSDEEITLAHSEDDSKLNKEKPEESKEKENAKVANEEEKESAEKERTVQDVLDDMTEEQRTVVDFLVGEALNADKDENESTDKEEEMNHNIFESDADAEETIEHALGLDCSMEDAITDMRRYGSLKQSFLAHNADLDKLVGEDALAHADQNYGIQNVDYLFPDYKSMSATPRFIQRRMEWVSAVMNNVAHTPFARTKSVFANITEDEARARGYIKGKLKKEEVFPLLKRTTDPQTIYKKQKLDRDDIIDITDMDVVSWLRQEMRVMLDEEVARAILIGDGRSASDEGKVSESHIRSVLNDDPFYSLKITKAYTAEPDYSTLATDFAEQAIRGREDYEGSGNPTLYTTESMLNNMLLLKDKMGRPMYKDMNELKTALRVTDIQTVQVMKNLTRTALASETELVGKTLEVDGIIVNIRDYNIGMDKGGAVSMFDDFDIDYNQEKYLIETRMSGALTLPYSAMVLEHYVDASATAGKTVTSKTSTEDAAKTE